MLADIFKRFGDKLNFGNEVLKQMRNLKQKSYLRIPDKELDLQ
jgi:hypothetical protein